MLESTSMISQVRHNLSVTRSAYPPEVFELMTDILADLVLEDLKRYPQMPLVQGSTESADARILNFSREKVKNERRNLRP